MFENVTKDNFLEMRQILLDVGEPIRSKGKKDKLEDHLMMLKKEFSTQPEICFYHSWLIVHIRRKINLVDSLKAFFLLWREEKEFLLKNLSLRWLVSACDTVIDYSESEIEIAYAMNVVLLINTVKLYETEELMIFNEHDISYSKNRPQEMIPLFDNLSAFRIGHGDMIKNMINRLLSVKANNVVTYDILLESVRRLHINGSVYKRMAKSHESDQTKWWKNEQFFIERS